jgi:phage gpG-like protein
MTGAAFTFNFDDGPVIAGLDRLQAALEENAGLLRIIGAYGRDSTVRRMESQTAPDGTPWTPLNPAYAAIKPAGYDILYLHGDLRNSQTFRAGVGEVSWGSPMVYAAAQQFGAVIVPKNAKALSFVLGDTFGAGAGKLYGLTQGVLVQVKSVTIPARPYLGLSAEDREEITLLAEEYLMRQMGPG